MRMFIVAAHGCLCFVVRYSTGHIDGDESALSDSLYGHALLDNNSVKKYAAKTAARYQRKIKALSKTDGGFQVVISKDESRKAAIKPM